MSEPDAQTSDRHDNGESRPLAPIPEEGTKAPSDSERVFGSGAGSASANDSNGSGASAAHRPSSPDDQADQAPTFGSRQSTPDEGPDRGGSGRGGGDRGGGDRGGTTSSPLQRLLGAGNERGRPGEPPSDETTQRLRSRGRVAMVCGAGALLVSVILFPTGFLVGLALGLAGLVVGLMAWWGGRKAGIAVPGAFVGILVGVGALALSLVCGITAAVFWDEVNDASQCLSGANTQTAANRCMDQLYDRLEQRVGPLPEPPR